MKVKALRAFGLGERLFSPGDICDIESPLVKRLVSLGVIEELVKPSARKRKENPDEL